MQIFKDIECLSLKNTVVTTGNFDGVHLGHQFLLKELVKQAKEQGRQSVVVMFYPHPREVLSADSRDFRYLSSQEDKYNIFESCGVDVVVEIAFNRDLAKWSADEFIKNILLDKIGMTLFLVGYDHKIGNPKKGNDILPLSFKYGFEIKQCRSFEKNGGISSSIVRESLLEGNVALASQLLGRYYSLKCSVIEGKKIGRSMGYPTANLQPIYDKLLIPSEGVYAVIVNIKGSDNKYGGMLQIGHRPTLDDGRGLTIEVHILDFDKDIYDHLLDVCFVRFVRENRRFSSVDALKGQLIDDERIIRSLLADL